MILPPTPENIASAGAALRSGELVGMPTETVYGIAASVWNPEAIRRTFEIKGRPADNPLIVHVAHLEQLDEVVAVWPDEARLLAPAWPPLALLAGAALTVASLSLLRIRPALARAAQTTLGAGERDWRVDAEIDRLSVRGPANGADARRLRGGNDAFRPAGDGDDHHGLSDAGLIVARERDPFSVGRN